MTEPKTEAEIAFEKWSRYEDVAMHFNDLLMRWRLQAMGGLATLVTVAGFVVGDVESFELRYIGMLILALTFTVVWVGMAIIDLSYYRQLLRGSVNAILQLEGKTELGVSLSTEIEKVAKTGGDRAPWAFYICGFLPLLGISIYAGYRLCHPPAEAAEKPPCAVCCATCKK